MLRTQKDIPGFSLLRIRSKLGRLVVFGWALLSGAGLAAPLSLTESVRAARTNFIQDGDSAALYAAMQAKYIEAINELMVLRGNLNLLGSKILASGQVRSYVEQMSRLRDFGLLRESLESGSTPQGDIQARLLALLKALGMSPAEIAHLLQNLSDEGSLSSDQEQKFASALEALQSSDDPEARTQALAELQQVLLDFGVSDQHVSVLDSLPSDTLAQMLPSEDPTSLDVAGTLASIEQSWQEGLNLPAFEEEFEAEADFAQLLAGTAPVSPSSGSDAEEEGVVWSPDLSVSSPSPAAEGPSRTPAAVVEAPVALPPPPRQDPSPVKAPQVAQTKATPEASKLDPLALSKHSFGSTSPATTPDPKPSTEASKGEDDPSADLRAYAESLSGGDAGKTESILASLQKQEERWAQEDKSQKALLSATHSAASSAPVGPVGPLVQAAKVAMDLCSNQNHLKKQAQKYLNHQSRGEISHLELHAVEGSKQTSRSKQGAHQVITTALAQSMENLGLCEFSAEKADLKTLARFTTALSMAHLSLMSATDEWDEDAKGCFVIKGKRQKAINLVGLWSEMVHLDLKKNSEATKNHECLVLSSSIDQNQCYQKLVPDNDPWMHQLKNCTGPGQLGSVVRERELASRLLLAENNCTLPESVLMQKLSAGQFNKNNPLIRKEFVEKNSNHKSCDLDKTSSAHAASIGYPALAGLFLGPNSQLKPQPLEVLKEEGVIPSSHKKIKECDIGPCMIPPM